MYADKVYTFNLSNLNFVLNHCFLSAKQISAKLQFRVGYQTNYLITAKHQRVGEDEDEGQREKFQNGYIFVARRARFTFVFKLVDRRIWRLLSRHSSRAYSILQSSDVFVLTSGNYACQ